MLPLSAFLAHLRSAPSAAPLALLSIDPGLRRCGYALCLHARQLPAPVVAGCGWVSSQGAGESGALALHTGVAAALVAQHCVWGVVVGHPLDPQGGRAGRECVFAEALARSLALGLGGAARQPPCPVLLWDERGSTAQARAGLRLARLQQRKGARPAQALPRNLGGRVDEAAATAILQSFLDAAQGL